MPHAANAQKLLGTYDSAREQIAASDVPVVERISGDPVTDKAPDDPYVDLVRRVLADEITLEAAAREAADLLQRPGIEGPHGFTLSLGASVPESKRLKRFFDLAKDEVLQRITADAPRDSTDRS